MRADNEIFNILTPNLTMIVGMCLLGDRDLLIRRGLFASTLHDCI